MAAVTYVTMRRLTLAAAGLALLAAGPAPARPPAPRTPADTLTGVWTNAWYTHLERPKAFAGRFATPAEVEAYEGPRRKLHGELSGPNDVLGQNESEFPDNGPGMARVGGKVPTSWIVDPADGKIPWTDEARKRLYIGDHPPEVLDNVENRDTDERCLTASGSGVPIINAHDANLVQIVQTPGWVALVAEKNHEQRFVEMTSAAPARSVPGGVWMGASRGHWEGATLVVETSGFRTGITLMHDILPLSDHARVVERWTRTGPKELTYAFEVSDPTEFTKPWRAEMVFRPAEGLLYEYACHEGNYSLPGILRAARAADQESKSGGGK
jgi:hypothetical protein